MGAQSVAKMPARMVELRQLQGDRVFQTSEPPFRRARRASLLALIGFVGLCVLVYAANGAVTATSVQGWYHTLVKPRASPPDWVFAPVWAALYATIGISAWLVWRRIEVGAHRKRAALRVWGWQLLLNALWPAAFFGMQSTGLGMLVIVPLLASIMATVAVFWPLQRGAAALLLPYLGWVCFATYLNAGFWWLNPV
jgi:benzodiazapine receptor